MRTRLPLQLQQRRLFRSAQALGPVYVAIQSAEWTDSQDACAEQ
jgi:hypothetical protein